MAITFSHVKNFTPFTVDLFQNTSGINLGNDANDEFLTWLITVLGIYTTGLLCGFGVFGNILSFIVLGKENKKLPLYTILRALAMSDSCLLLSTLLLQVIANCYEYTGAFYDVYMVQGWLAEVVWPISMIAQMSSVWLTVVTSIERWVAVCHPLKAGSLCTTKRARLSVLGVVVVSICYNLPRFWEYTAVGVPKTDPSEANVTATHWTPNKTKMAEDHIYRYLYSTCMYFIFIFLLPLILITIFNVQLVYTLKKARKQWAHVNRRMKKEHKITLIPICIVIVFYICATPVLLANVIDSIFVTINSIQYDTYLVVSNMLTTLNSAVNFIIYCMLGKKFRQTLWRMVCGARHGSSKYANTKGGTESLDDTL